MKIQVEFLLEHRVELFEVACVPRIGESVCEDDETCHEVKDVIHALNVIPATDIVAIVRVK